MRRRSRIISLLTALLAFAIATHGVSAHAMSPLAGDSSATLGDVEPDSGLLASVTDGLTNGNSDAGQPDAGLLDDLVEPDSLVDEVVDDVLDGETADLVDEVLETVEEPLEDVVEEAAGEEVAETVSDTLDTVGEAVDPALDEVDEALEVAEPATDELGDTTEAITETLDETTDSRGTDDAAPLDEVVEDVVEEIVDGVVEITDEVVDDALDPVVEEIVEPIVEPVVETVEEIVEPVVEEVVDPVLETVEEEVVEPIVEAVEPVLDGVDETLDDLIEPGDFDDPAIPDDEPGEEPGEDDPVGEDPDEGTGDDPDGDAGDPGDGDDGSDGSDDPAAEPRQPDVEEPNQEGDPREGKDDGTTDSEPELPVADQPVDRTPPANDAGGDVRNAVPAPVDVEQVAGDDSDGSEATAPEGPFEAVVPDEVEPAPLDPQPEPAPIQTVPDAPIDLPAVDDTPIGLPSQPTVVDVPPPVSESPINVQPTIVPSAAHDGAAAPNALSDNAQEIGMRAPHRATGAAIDANLVETPAADLEGGSGGIADVIDEIFDTPRVPAPAPTSVITSLMTGSVAVVAAVILLMGIATSNRVTAFALSVPSTTHHTVPKPPG